MGDVIWAVTHTGLTATPQTVVALSKTVEHGLHSPVLTNGAFPVVDGVVTSFDSISKVVLASYGLKYLEPLLKLL